MRRRRGSLIMNEKSSPNTGLGNDGRGVPAADAGAIVTF